MAEMYEPTLITDLLERAAAMEPDKTAVVSGEVRLTYREFHERVGRAAAMLQQTGIAPGDRVAILDKNSHYYLELYFALPQIGAVATGSSCGQRFLDFVFGSLALSS